MNGSKVTGRGQNGAAKRDLTWPGRRRIGRAVIGALAVPTALVLLSGCSSTPHGKITALPPGSPTTDAATPTAATTPTAAPTPTATPSATASKKGSPRPRTTKPPVATSPSRVSGRKNLALAAASEDVVYLGVSNGHLLTVDGNGKVSTSGTKVDDTTRLLLQQNGRIDGADAYMIMSPLNRQKGKDYCLSNTTRGTFILKICDWMDQTQTLVFYDVGNREFDLGAYMGPVSVNGTSLLATPLKPPAKFTVTITARH